YRQAGSDYVKDMLTLAGKTHSRTVAYGTDAAMLTEMQNLVVFGPGDIDQAHTHDEWIALEQLDLGTQMYARAIRQWCL
ncbi:MAG: M20/M25/M40 family metallo-hydrolase, partial [Planctomycetaceae bacterium]